MVYLRSGDNVRLPKESSIVTANIVKIDGKFVLLRYDDAKYKNEWVMKVSLEGYNSEVNIGDCVTIPKNSSWETATVKKIEEALAQVQYSNTGKREWISLEAISSTKPARIGESVMVNKFSCKERCTVIKIQSPSCLVAYNNKKLGEEWVIENSLLSNKLPLITHGSMVRVPKQSCLVDAKVVSLDDNFVKVEYFDPRFKPEWIIKQCALATLQPHETVQLPIIPEEMNLKSAPDHLPGNLADTTNKVTTSNGKDQKIHGFEVHEIKNVFRLFDIKDNDWIDEADLAHAMQSLGLFVSNKEAKDILGKWDKNSDGKISFEQFLHFVKNRPRDSTDKLRSAFKKYDIDGDGSIHLDELRKALTTRGEPMTNEEVDEFFSDMDKDGSGTIDFEEFISYMLNP